MSYQGIFDQAIGATPPSTVDVDEVMRRQRRATRRRPVLAAAVAALVAAGTVVGVGWLGGGEDPPPPTDRLAGFPEYVDGTRVIAATEAPMTDRTLSLTFTPTTLDLKLFSDCRDHELTDWNLGLSAEVTVEELTADLPYCPNLGIYEGGFEGADAWTDFWAATGVEVGEPVTITVTLTGVVPLVTDIDEVPPLPSEGTFALAVAEIVPFEEYQLPPRPNPLAELPDAPGSWEVDLRADPTDPNGPAEATMAWDRELAECDMNGGVFPLELISQTPGSLRVLINDVEVAHSTWWDYEQAPVSASMNAMCRQLDDGEQVTVTVQPEYMTGDWQVRIGPGMGG